MYSTCLFCTSPLGSNEIIEAFPVGRRLAFDPAKGRLWVVCRKCGRWNLSPLEERWEAFEECERRFRDTRLRMSTDHIGLARLSEGLELVRIGEPLRPEFAAWRYGDQFGRRRKRAMLLTGAGIGGFVVLQIGLTALGSGAGAFYGCYHLVENLPVRARIRGDDGKVKKLRASDLLKVGLYRDGHEWAVNLDGKKKSVLYTGERATQMLIQLLPAINRMAGKKAEIAGAVSAIEQSGHPEVFLEQLKAERGSPAERWRESQKVTKMSPVKRLALEMALHEEQERRALEGELHDLEMAWKEAEEIANISDNMFVPREHEDFIKAHRTDGARTQDGPPR